MNIDEYYRDHYEKVVNTGIVGKFASRYHNLMERDFKNKSFGKILEVGAGKGQHIEYVRCEYDSYTQTDIREIPQDAGHFTRKVVSVQADAQNLLNFDDGQFNRTIATCLLAHLSDPEAALSEWRRVTEKNGGVLTLYVPCEPSLLLRIAQRLSTRRKTRKLGINYESMHYREHRNHYFFLRAIILDVFTNDKVKVIAFPGRLLPFNFKLYEIYQIQLVDPEGNSK
jgi:ubiquinone/menaquinone biosynthesis C-methylase UbiE